MIFTKSKEVSIRNVVSNFLKQLTSKLPSLTESDAIKITIGTFPETLILTTNMEKAALELESKFDDTEKRLDKVCYILQLIPTLWLLTKQKTDRFVLCYAITEPSLYI